ncbi:MAG: LamG domain-containing protein [Planctomycetes bacterium]|nr:LamG domain-containing protein [Planctomycetota bacterium]
MMEKDRLKKLVGHVAKGPIALSRLEFAENAPQVADEQLVVADNLFVRARSSQLLCCMTIIMLLGFISGVNAKSINSVTGTISFDANNDGQAEALLNTQGLGVGSSPSEALHIQGNAIVSDFLTVGTPFHGSANLQINGTIGFSPGTISSNGMLNGLNSIVLLDPDTAGGNLTTLLPMSSNHTGRILKMKNTSSTHSVKVLGPIENNDSMILSPNESLQLVSNGSNWYIIGSLGSPELGTSSDNLVSWFQFEEGSGNMVYDRAGGYHAFANQFTENGNEVHIATGAGYAGNFMDSHEHAYCEIIDTSALSFGEDFTFTAWVYRNGFDNWCGVFVLEDAVTGDKFYLNSNETNSKDRIVVGTAVDASQGVNSGDSPSLNTWYHLAFRHQPSIQRVQVLRNGVQIMDLNYVGTLSTGNPLLFYIGTTWRWATYFDGFIDDFRIYNKALSDDQISAVMESFSPE